MTSSIPAAIDYLVTAITALPECAAPCVVQDGWPTKRGNLGVAIGVVPGDGTTEDEVTEAQLGAQLEWEEYEIPCICWAYVGGDSAKAARDAAFVLFDAIVAAVRVNPAGRTLGGALNSGFAMVRAVRVSQTSNVQAAGEGRQCEISFSVRGKNRF